LKRDLSDKQFHDILKIIDDLITYRIEETLRLGSGDTIRQMVNAAVTEAVADILGAPVPEPEPFSESYGEDRIDGDHLTGVDIARALDEHGVAGDLRN
jgi:hypothetical protein